MSGLHTLIAIGLIALTPLLTAANPAGVDTVAYDDVPVAITIPVNHETIVRMPEAVEVGLPSAFVGVVSVEITNKVVLITANKAVKGRIALRALNASNKIYLIDIDAATNAPKHSVQIVNAPAPGATAALTTAPEHAGEDIRLLLTRFAAREFYAPERLRGGLKASRVAIRSNIVELYRGSAMIAQPRASWQYRRHYVTAIELTNQTPDPRELDPRLLRGNWITATFQHSLLQPAGSIHSSTMLYVVSDRPFGDSL